MVSIFPQYDDWPQANYCQLYGISWGHANTSNDKSYLVVN